ncbi:MAG: hypothetical protein ACR2K6_03030 [Solirubrobacterales bacterium]
MKERRQRALRERVFELVGKEIDDVALLFAGPSFTIWVGAAAAIGIVLTLATGIGGAIGGAVIGGLVGSWYLFAQQIALAVSADEAHLVALSEPPLRKAEPKGELIRHPRGAAPVTKRGAEVDYGGRKLQALIFSGAEAERLVDKAAGEEPVVPDGAQQPPFPP